MSLNLRSPGIYRQDLFPTPAPTLLTGVPGFVGFGQAASGAPFVNLARKDDLLQAFTPGAGSYLPQVVAGFFDNGGQQCFIAGADPALKDREAALAAAIDGLENCDDLDLLAVPDAMTLLAAAGGVDEAAVARLQRQALMQCARRDDRVAILDALPGAGQIDPQSGLSRAQVQSRQAMLGVGDIVNGALYLPWLSDAAGGLTPPCGHVAGVIAGSDAAVGVHKAPANVAISGVLDLEFDVDDSLQAQLNPDGINCLRAFPGRGIRVWGARTLSADPAWRYLSVRRLFLTLSRWIDLNLGWVVFESNSPALWTRVERALNRHLESLWRGGALQGATAEQAFYVRCDAQTNPASGRDDGLLVTEIGLAPASPAEFVVVRLSLRADAPVPV